MSNKTYSNITSSPNIINPRPPPPQASAIDFYFSVTAVPLGILFNLLTIAVFWADRRSKKDSNSMRLLYMALGVYDILALLNSFLFIQFLPFLKINLTNYTDWLCKLTNVWRKMATQMPSWIQVLLTFDRLRSVVFPNRWRSMTKPSCLFCVIFALTLTISLANVGFIWFYLQEYPSSSSSTSTPSSPQNSSQTSKQNQSINSSTSTQVVYKCSGSQLVSTMSDFINVVLRFIFPFVLMIIMNIVLVSSVFVSKTKTVAATLSRSKRREINYTITVIGLNLIFFTLNLPWCAWYILNAISLSGDAYLSTPQIKRKLETFKSIAFCIYYLDNLSLFFLNFAFNRIFRARVLFLIHNMFSKEDQAFNLYRWPTIMSYTNSMVKQKSK